MTNVFITFSYFTAYVYVPPSVYPIIPNRLPYMASVYINTKRIVSGSLISLDHVLTTARGVVEVIMNGGIDFVNASILVDLTVPWQYRTMYGIAGVHHYHYTQTCIDYIENAKDIGILLVGLLSTFKFIIKNNPYY